MNRLIKIIAVTLSASLLLFGCSRSDRQILANETTANETTDTETAEQQKGSSVVDAEDAIAENRAEPFGIHINQIGYRAADKKLVTVSGEAAQFTVMDKTNGTQVFVGAFTKGNSDSDSGDELYYGDFTEIREAGTYYIVVPGVGLTESFAIGDDVYNELKDSLLKSFYYQRCGLDLTQEFADKWTHVACHTGNGKVYGNDGIEFEAAGGWHDAGDYGKYVVPGAVAAADLLMTWELFPDSYGDDIDIPESGNGVPDILDEARFELEWLLKMQDKDTGGIYHKLTSKGFPPLAMLPQDDLSELFFSPVSAAATGGFSAVTAMASRIYRNFDIEFAQLCLKASEDAWTWLENNKSIAGFTNPRDITTGEYGDNNDSDERLWAATELYRATGDEVYAGYIGSEYKRSGLDSFGFGWQSVSGYAGVSYLFNNQPTLDRSIYDDIKKSLLTAAKDRLQKSEQSGYNVTLDSTGYNWGSNMTVLNDARLLILADMLEPSEECLKAAQSNFNYILGTNTLGQCYVTGFGHKPVLDPHHRPSKGDDEELPVPGMVAGGPNSGLQDDFAKINLKGLPPARCYIDHSGSYSTNEVAIYWNSPAVFVAAYFGRRD